MKVGFLGFGEVALNLSHLLTQGGAEVYTSLENRSIKTQIRVKESEVNICKDNQALAELSDILISSVTPAQAENIAKEVGQHVRGVYVDVNNISPQTVLKALGYIKNGKTADAAIMGGVNIQNIQTLILASGRCAKEFSKLNSYGLNIKVLGLELGKAKTLKMLRSRYTKGVSALLFETLLTSYKFGLDKELLKCLELTEGSQFIDSVISRINSSAVHAQRRSEEMDEIMKFTKNTDLSGENKHMEMVKAAREIYRYISKTYNTKNKPDGYRDVLKYFTKE